MRAIELIGCVLGSLFAFSGLMVLITFIILTWLVNESEKD
tara:strand:+ start:148 stop:267 length:120 start_codon:yes stop_codon:yes gene_type:complete